MWILVDTPDVSHEPKFGSSVEFVSVFSVTLEFPLSHSGSDSGKYVLFCCLFGNCLAAA